MEIPKHNAWYNKKYGHKATGKIRMAILRRVITEIYPDVNRRMNIIIIERRRSIKRK